MSINDVWTWVKASGSFTDWLQAIGTVGALWFAVVQVTRDGRAARRRDRTHLIAAHKAILTTMNALKGIREKFDSGPLQQAAWSLSETRMFESMLAQLEAVPLQDLPDADTIEAVMAARITLRSGAIDLERARAGQPSTPDFIGYSIGRLEHVEGVMWKAVKKAHPWWWRAARWIRETTVPLQRHQPSTT